MRPARRVLSLAAGLIALSSFASGYYHWVFFANHDGPYSPGAREIRSERAAEQHGFLFHIRSKSGPVDAGRQLCSGREPDPARGGRMGWRGEFSVAVEIRRDSDDRDAAIRSRYRRRIRR